MVTAIVTAWRTGTRSSMALPSRLSMACWLYQILPERWRKHVQPRCPIGGRPRSSARLPRYARGCLPARMRRRVDLGGLGGLHGHHIVVMGRGGDGVPLEVIAAHADLVAHEFIAELESIQPVARNGAVAQPYHRAPQDRLEFVLQLVERVEALGVFHPLADIENGGGKF